MQIVITKSKFGLLGVALLSLAFLGVAYAVGTIGADEGKTSLERLQLVWPEVLDLPHADRVLLARLSIDCQLAEKPLERDAVVQCLRQAAAMPSDRIPAGSAADSGAEMLEILLSEAGH